MKGEDRIKKAHRIAKAYEDAGFLFSLDAKARLKQMAAWAGISEHDASRFSRMVECAYTSQPEPMPMALGGDDDDAPWVMSVDIEEMNKHYNLSMDKPDDECAAGLHSWVDEVGQLDPNTRCTRCGELYGYPREDKE